MWYIYIYLFIHSFIHLQHAGYRSQYSDQATDLIIVVRVPVKSRDLFYSKMSVPTLGPPNLLLSVCGTCYTQRVKRPGRDANHSHPASAKVQNDRKYTSIPPIYLRGVYKGNLPFTLV
jgi:hypothetical protein